MKLRLGNAAESSKKIPTPPPRSQLHLFLFSVAGKDVTRDAALERDTHLRLDNLDGGVRAAQTYFFLRRNSPENLVRMRHRRQTPHRFHHHTAADAVVPAFS